MFVRACIRAHERTSRWKILFTSYLVVELSPGAEIWCVYATSINDGTQILTFLGIQNKRDFQNSRFFCGNLIIFNPELHWFLFSDRLQLLQSFPELCTHSQENLLQRSTYAQLGWCSCVRSYVRTHVTLENIVHSISRGRTVINCWNLVCVCNKYQWWYSDLNIPVNSQQSRFSEFSVFLWEFDYITFWVALISIFRSHFF